MKSDTPARLKLLIQRVKRLHPRLPVSSVFRTLKSLHRGHGSWFAPSDVWARTKGVSPELVLKTMRTIADEPFSILKTQWVFYTNKEPTIEDPTAAAEIPISAREALEAATSGEVENPETGEVVPAEGRIGLFYEANDQLWNPPRRPSRRH